MGGTEDDDWLTMKAVRQALPWPLDLVTLRDHSFLPLVAQALPGWAPGFKQPSPRRGEGNLYRRAALPWFARAAEVVALVRVGRIAGRSPTDESAGQRCARFAAALRGGGIP